MKQLVLFDIDGTILSTNGAARRAFHAGMLEVYGTAGPIETHAFDGKTDPQIARELLSHAGLDQISVKRVDPFGLAHQSAQRGTDGRIHRVLERD